MRKLFLVALLISMTTWGEEPVISPSLRSKQPINQIRKMFYQIRQVDEERASLNLSPVINLSIGQPHIGMQPNVIDPFISYLEGLKKLSPEALSVEMGYDHSSGNLETRKWISRFYTETFPEITEGFKPEEVMVTNGGTGALSNALKVLIGEGDEVAIFAPYFSAYEAQVVSCDGKIVPLPLVFEGSRPQVLEDLLSAHPRIKALIWNDPSNPLGTKVEREELEKIAEILAKYPNLVIIHDEVYRDTVHDGKPLSLLNVAPELKARSFIIRSLAKDILGAPGIRAGMISAPTQVETAKGEKVNFIELMSNEQLRECASVSVLVQKILCIALEQKMQGVSAAWEKSMRKEYAYNIQILIRELAKAGLHPLEDSTAAFFAMIDASSLMGKKVPKKIGLVDNLDEKVGPVIQTDFDVAMYFLYAAGVAVVPGSGFHAGYPCFRVSCARSQENLLEAGHRIKEAVEALL